MLNRIKFLIYINMAPFQLFSFSSLTHTSSSHEGRIDSQQFTDDFCTSGAVIIDEIGCELHHGFKFFMAELSETVTLSTSVLGKRALMHCLNRFVNTFKIHLTLEFNVIEVSAHLHGRFKKTAN